MPGNDRRGIDGMFLVVKSVLRALLYVYVVLDLEDRGGQTN